MSYKNKFVVLLSINSIKFFYYPTTSGMFDMYEVANLEPVFFLCTTNSSKRQSIFDAVQE